MVLDIIYAAIATALSYLVGGIPFGWIAGKLVKGIDIRYHGSGSVGATNTLRTLGWQVSALVFAADLLKGLVPVLVVRTVLNDPFAESTVALAAMIGHCWSPYLGFYGGRGVTTSLGSMFAFHPLVAVAGFFRNCRYRGGDQAGLIGFAARLLWHGGVARFPSVQRKHERRSSGLRGAGTWRHFAAAP